MRKFRLLAMLMIAATAACTPPKPARNTDGPIRILSQQSGNDSALRAPIVHVIQTRRQLESFGAANLNDIDINFNVHNLLLVALGEQPTSGWWVRVDQVQLVGNELFFQGVANAPTRNQIVAQVLTYPYTAVVIPRVGKVQVRAEIESVRGQSPQ